MLSDITFCGEKWPRKIGEPESISKYIIRQLQTKQNFDKTDAFQ